VGALVANGRCSQRAARYLSSSNQHAVPDRFNNSRRPTKGQRLNLLDALVQHCAKRMLSQLSTIAFLAVMSLVQANPYVGSPD
jgi:hypothetical protein